MTQSDILIERARDAFNSWCAAASAAPWTAVVKEYDDEGVTEYEAGSIPGVADNYTDDRGQLGAPLTSGDARLIAGICGSPEIREAIREMLDDPIVVSEPPAQPSTWEKRYRAHCERVAAAIVRFDVHATHTPNQDIVVGSTFRADTVRGGVGGLFFAANDGMFYDINGVQTNPDEIVAPTVRTITPPPA